MLNFLVTDEICKNISNGEMSAAMGMFNNPDYCLVTNYYYDVSKQTFFGDPKVGIALPGYELHNIENLGKIVRTLSSCEASVSDKRYFLKPILYSDKVKMFNENLFPFVGELFSEDEMINFKNHLASKNQSMEVIVYRLDCVDNEYAVYHLDNSEFINKVYRKKD